MTKPHRRFSALLTLLSATAVMGQASTASAAPFTAGNLVIYRVGDGAGTLINTGNPVFLDEFTPAGVLVQSVPAPTMAGPSGSPLVASGTATSEGFLARSANGKYLLLTGYGSTLPAASGLAGTSAATVPRVIGRADLSGAIDTTTALTDAADGNNPRSATSPDGQQLFITGGAGGIRCAALGATTSTQLSTTVVNLRQTHVVDGQLYVSTASGSAVRIGAVGTGATCAAGQTITNLPGYPPSGAGPYGFFLADLNAGVAGPDVLYVANDTVEALTKYSLVGGAWTLNGTVGVDADDYRGVTGVVSGSTITLYATRKGGSTATGGGEYVSLVDASGYNGAFAGTPTLLATATANTAFRGIAPAPVSAAPVPAGGSGPFAAMALVLAALGGLLIKNRVERTRGGELAV